MLPKKGLPRYRCHKEVRAMRIDDIELSQLSREFYLHSDELKDSIAVDWEWLDKHQPKLGGYLVVYDDGYMSYSPAKPFEDGYTRIDAEPQAP